MIISSDLVTVRDDETLSYWLDNRRRVESGEFDDYFDDICRGDPDREDFHSDG